MMLNPKHHSFLPEEASCIRNRRPNSIGSIYGFGDVSYCDLISQAILSSPTQKLSLYNIYQWMEQNANFFIKASPNWKNSIRHNLSVYDRFINSKCKVTKKRFWSVNVAAGYSHRGSQRSKKQVQERENRPKRKMGRSSSLSSISSCSSYQSLSDGGLSPLPDQLDDRSYRATNNQKETSLMHYIFSKSLTKQYDYNLDENISSMNCNIPQTISAPINSYNHGNNGFTNNYFSNAINNTNQSFPEYNIPVHNHTMQNTVNNILKKNCPNSTFNAYPPTIVDASEISNPPASNSLTVIYRPYHFSGGVVLEKESNFLTPLYEKAKEKKHKNVTECLGSNQSLNISQLPRNNIFNNINDTSFAVSESINFDQDHASDYTSIPNLTTPTNLTQCNVSKNAIQSCYVSTADKSLQIPDLVNIDLYSLDILGPDFNDVTVELTGNGSLDVGYINDPTFR